MGVAGRAGMACGGRLRDRDRLRSLHAPSLGRRRDPRRDAVRRGPNSSRFHRGARPGPVASALAPGGVFGRAGVGPPRRRHLGREGDSRHHGPGLRRARFRRSAPSTHRSRSGPGSRRSTRSRSCHSWSLAPARSSRPIACVRRGGASLLFIGSSSATTRSASPRGPVFPSALRARTSSASSSCREHRCRASWGSRSASPGSRLPPATPRRPRSSSASGSRRLRRPASSRSAPIAVRSPVGSLTNGSSASPRLSLPAPGAVALVRRLAAELHDRRKSLPGLTWPGADRRTPPQPPPQTPGTAAPRGGLRPGRGVHSPR